MKRKYSYLLLTAIGIIVPYYFFVGFLITHGLDGRAFVQELFGTDISAFFAANLLLAAWCL
jgi:hypothetical protein